MIPTQYVRPSTHLVKSAEHLLATGYPLLAGMVMDHALVVIKGERDHLRADLRTAQAQIKTNSRTAPTGLFDAFFQVVGESFAPLVDAIDGAFKLLQKPVDRGDFAKAN